MNYIEDLMVLSQSLVRIPKQRENSVLFVDSNVSSAT